MCMCYSHAFLIFLCAYYFQWLDYSMSAVWFVCFLTSVSILLSGVFVLYNSCFLRKKDNTVGLGIVLKYCKKKKKQ